MITILSSRKAFGLLLIFRICNSGKVESSLATAGRLPQSKKNRAESRRYENARAAGGEFLSAYGWTNLDV